MRFRRQAFTLVELLVVIAIIGILVALLLPAVQAARESARRTECSNHLKQFGIAFQNHHDTYQMFPTGGVGWTYPPDFSPEGIPEIAPKQRAGWGFQILPFIEQKTVWEGNGGVDNEDKQREAIGAKIPTFFCYSRRRAQAFNLVPWYPPPPPPNSNSYPHAQTDYAASDGMNDGVVIATGANQNWTNQGPITTSDIRDGASYTMCVGEKRMNVGPPLGGYQGEDNEGYTSGWDHDVIRWTDREPRPDVLSGTGDYRFGSSHPGGFQATFADASVRLVPWSVDLTVFRRMGCRRDGETITLP